MADWTKFCSRARRITHGVAASALLIGSLAFASTASAQTILNSQMFDSAYSNSIVQLQQGCVHTWLQNGGWRGGAAKFTPPTTGEGACGVWAFDFAGMAQVPEQVNVRFLLFHGSTWQEYGPGNKLVIINRNGNDGRPMVITQKYDNWETMSACDGTVCKFDQGGGYSQGGDRLKIGNPPLAREEEWISVELEANTRTGMIRLYIDTQDGDLQGLYIERYMDDTGPGGTWSFGGVGGYMRQAVRSDPNNYFLIDELVVASSRIGPPAGFGNSTRPRPASSVSAQ
jgi:hypothetical protein